MNSDLLLRRAILLQLDAAFPASLPFCTLADGLRAAGFAVQGGALERHIEYLAQKGVLATVSSRICAGSRRTKITAAGIDYLQGGIF